MRARKTDYPLRKVLRRYESKAGPDMELLECGHRMPRPSDMRGPTTASRRRCRLCPATRGEQLSLPIELPERYTTD